MIQHESVLWRILELEEKHKNDSDWLGFEWRDIPTYPGVLNRLAAEGLVITVHHSRKYTVYRANHQAILDLLGSSDETLDIPNDLFDIIVGYEEYKNILLLSLASPEPVHCLLVGSVATAKSLFLSEIARIGHTRFALGGSSSKAGIIDFLLTERPRILAIDEIDKTSREDLSSLLSLMESGTVSRLKYHKAELEKIKVRVFAGANSIARLPPELLSRFVILRFSPYTQEEFCRIVLNILTKREGLSPSQAMYIADRLKNRTPDVRDAVKLARLSGGDRPIIDNLISTLYDKVCGDDKRGRIYA